MKNFLVLGLLLFIMTGISRADPQAKEKKQELKSLQQQIKKLKVELDKTKANQSQAVNALQQSELAIAEANRILTTLQLAQKLNQDQLNKVQAEIEAVKKHILTNQMKLIELLKTRYQQGYYESWRLILTQEDPYTVQRDLQYYTYIAQAQQKLGNQLKQQLLSLDQLSEKIRKKQRELAAIQSQKHEQRVVLEGEKHRKVKALTVLAKDMEYKKTQLQRLKTDEKNLTTLVNKLNRLIQQVKQNQGIKRKPQIRPKSSEDKSLQPFLEKDRARGFLALKGHLLLPVRGKILGRFGENREEGSTWKGLLIEASVGQPIKVVADGQVIFADWLRGFGNIIIVSHGEGYMSLYGQNESILKKVGDEIKAGEVIATVGNSGDAQSTGLYFEIRRHGQPQNPLQWIASE